MKTYILIFLIAFTIVFKTSTAQKKERLANSIFWKITPSNGGKPSYLYGTMHVSKKIAFNLPDTFFKAINSCDKVALESNPEYWSESLDKSEKTKDILNIMSVGLKQSTAYGSNFYARTLGINLLTPTIIKKQLSTEPIDVNNLLFRSYNMNTNLEESTYLDLFIYKIGKRYNKEVVSLEDVAGSFERIINATIEQQTAEKPANTMNLYEIQQQIEDAYRSKNIEAIDSLMKLSSSSEKYLNELLYYRNDTMIASMTYQMKNGVSIFAGVGAAHLPGEKGIIKKLKKMGYKVEPIIVKEQNNPAKFIDSIDKIYVPKYFTKKYTKDSSISYYTTAYSKHSTFSSKVEYLATDMDNGIYYSLCRINSFENITKKTSQTILKEIDSLIFENTQGSITNKSISTHQNYPCYDIESKTKDDKIIKQKIIVTPLEVIFLKVSGKAILLNQQNLDSFFNKIEINYKKVNNKINDEHKTKGFDIQMPISITDAQYEHFEINNANLLIQGLDNDNDYFSIIRNYNVKQKEFEEDSFHLAMYSTQLEDILEAKLEKTTYSQLKQYPCLYANYLIEGNKRIQVCFVSTASNLFTLITNSQNQPKTNQFFNSLQFNKETSTEFKEICDSTAGFCFKTTCKPYGNTYSKKVFTLELKAQENEYNPRKNIFTGVYINTDWGYQYTINVKELNKYEACPSVDSFWKKLYTSEIKSLENNFIVSKKTDSIQRKSMQITLTDTNTKSIGIILYMLYDNKLLECLTYTDSISVNNTQLLQGLNSIKAVSNDKQAEYITSSKLDTFYHHYFKGNEKQKKYLQDYNAYLDIVQSDEKRLINLLDTSILINKDENVLRNLMYNLSSIQNQSTYDLLKKIYKKNESNASIQTTALNNLHYMYNKDAQNVFKELLLESPPLLEEISSEYDESTPITLQYDSLVFAQQLFPEAIQLMDYDAYKDDLISLMSEMVKKKMLDPKVYEPRIPAILLKAKEELRRVLSQKNELETYLESKVDTDENEYSPDDRRVFETGFDDEKPYRELDGNQFYILKEYITLLEPFKSKQNVSDFLSKADTSHQNDLLFFKAVKNIKDTLPFDQEIMLKYLEIPQYTFYIMHMYYYYGLINKLPAKYQTQQAAAWARINQTLQLDNKDEVKFVEKKWVSYKKASGYIYIFKHKKAKQKNDDPTPEYKYSFYGLFDKNEKNLMPTKYILHTQEELSEKTEKELIEQFVKQISVIDRTYITPQDIGKKNDDYNYLMNMFNNIPQGE